MTGNFAPSDALSVGIVMSDLFISATAALLIVLALAQPFKPRELPIQADLIAHCPADETPQDQYSIAVQSATQPEPHVSVSEATDLGTLPGALLLQPRLFYSVALVEAKGHPLTPTCLKWVQQKLIKPWNKALQGQDQVEGLSRAIFSATASLAPAENEAENE